MLRFHDLHGADYAAPVTGQRPVADRWWGERFPTRARVLACIASALALAACGGGSSTNWKGVRSVSVTVSRPGLPPPGGTPRTTAFTSRTQLARVTAALNAQHITKTPSSSSTSPCAGGQQIAITITQANAAPTHLSAYACGGKTSGDIGGNLSKFLVALGVPSNS
jgi:hypothetical protein